MLPSKVLGLNSFIDFLDDLVEKHEKDFSIMDI
jgi:hypothetical protein